MLSLLEIQDSKLLLLMRDKRLGKTRCAFPQKLIFEVLKFKKKHQRFDIVINHFLLQMQECGQPPSELVGEMVRSKDEACVLLHYCFLCIFMSNLYN